MSDQCEHSGPHGQCHNSRVDGSAFCDRHSNEAERIKGYRLSSPELRERYEHHASATLASVRQEIILLRAMIEDRLSLATNEAERLVAFKAVRPALVDVVKCVDTLTKLEQQTSVVLGKEALAALSGKIISILSGALADVPDHDRIIDLVAKQIAAAIADAHNEG
jgi:hypothetical protein